MPATPDIYICRQLEVPIKLFSHRCNLHLPAWYLSIYYISNQNVSICLVDNSHLKGVKGPLDG